MSDEIKQGRFGKDNIGLPGKFTSNLDDLKKDIYDLKSDLSGLKSDFSKLQTDTQVT